MRIDAPDVKRNFSNPPPPKKNRQKLHTCIDTSRRTHLLEHQQDDRGEQRVRPVVLLLVAAAGRLGEQVQHAGAVPHEPPTVGSASGHVADGSVIGVLSRRQHVNTYVARAVVVQPPKRDNRGDTGVSLFSRGGGAATMLCISDSRRFLVMRLSTLEQSTTRDEAKRVGGPYRKVYVQVTGRLDRCVRRRYRLDRGDERGVALRGLDRTHVLQGHPLRLHIFPIFVGKQVNHTTVVPSDTRQSKIVVNLILVGVQCAGRG